VFFVGLCARQIFAFTFSVFYSFWITLNIIAMRIMYLLRETSRYLFRLKPVLLGPRFIASFSLSLASYAA